MTRRLTGKADAVTVRGTHILDNGEGVTVLIRLADGKVTIPD